MAGNDGGCDEGFPDGYAGNRSASHPVQLSVSLSLFQQIGNNNIMNITRPNPDINEYLSSDSDEEYDSDQQPDEQVQRMLDCTQEITNMDLQNLSHILGGHGLAFVEHLGVDECDVQAECSKQHSGITPPILYKLLQDWKNESVDPTVSTITHAMYDLRLQHLIKKFHPKNLVS